MISIEISVYNYLIPRISSIINPILKSPEKVKFGFFFFCTGSFYLCHSFFFLDPRLSLIVVPSNIPDVTVDGKELFTTMMAETARLDPHIIPAIKKLKGKQ